MWKLDRHRQIEYVRRMRLVDGLTIDHPDRRPQGKILRRATLRARPGCRKRLHERSRAPVHDRRLGAVELNRDVVHFGSRHRRQHVLHRVDRVVPGAELCSPLGEYRVLDDGANGR
jgi:hypothetical protein